MKIVGWGALSLVLILALGYGLTWIGLIGDRPFQKYQEETRTQGYEKSRQYQQGTELDIARYCMQMKTAQERSAKRAVAQLIVTTAATYAGPRSPETESCVSEAKGY